jgi:hypothetical protein
MSDLIRRFLKPQRRPLEALQNHEIDSISDAQRDYMRQPPPVGPELLDGMMRDNDDRSHPLMQPIPPLYRNSEVEDPNYPVHDQTVPPKHRRT